MPRGWDKKYRHKRNWVNYNEHLVKRGEFYLSLDFLQSWDEEIRRMNSGKRGRPFLYPDSFIRFTAILYHVFSLPYRQLEGVLRSLFRYLKRAKSPDYTTLFRRLSTLDIHLNLTDIDDNMVIAVDSTGVKVTNRGEWIRHKWKVKRGWIKLHVAVDVKSGKTVSYRITTEKVGDNAMFKPLIEDAYRNTGGKKIERVYGDGAYDTRSAFNLMEEKGILPAIKIRKTASTRSRGSPYRARYVREYKRVGYEKWREEVEYGKRWRVESTFSALKRIFGEGVRASSAEQMFREVEMRIMIYNLLLSI
ncbi:MAG: IS5 family transposase [Thaumarchaeota archaeon]|nr:IS5 family transposase [Nitrososphaerota archaeon]